MHLEMGHVNEYVVTGEYSGLLLAQAAINHGTISVVSEILTYKHGNQFYRLPVAETWHGRTFDELFDAVKKQDNAILVAVQHADGKNLVNPTDYTLLAGDSVMVIAEREISL